MRSLWQDEAPAFQGRYASFDGVDAYPRPVQNPLPVVVGGHADAAFRRAARHADGWYGFLVGLRAMAQYREALDRAIERAGRERPLHVSISPSRPLDPETVRAYADLGVDRLIVIPPPGLTLDEVEQFVESNAPGRVGGAAAA
jgi:alkanesulfonate monooxygenase SsuD/methylene tetrahydromethanopterin reductase-like flavin-dependent oxidoreductase (luciferase family)